MSFFHLTRETVLDLVVNLIPLGIIVFFMVMFLVADPFGGGDLQSTVMSQFLLVVPLVTLAALSYVSGRLVQRDEARTRE